MVVFALQAASPSVSTDPCRVDVCAAGDCVGRGGGACFLEIEELVAEIGLNIEVRGVLRWKSCES